MFTARVQQSGSSKYGPNFAKMLSRQGEYLLLAHLVLFIPPEVIELFLRSLCKVCNQRNVSFACLSAVGMEMIG